MTDYSINKTKGGDEVKMPTLLCFACYFIYCFGTWKGKLNYSNRKEPNLLAELHIVVFIFYLLRKCLKILLFAKAVKDNFCL